MCASGEPARFLAVSRKAGYGVPPLLLARDGEGRFTEPTTAARRMQRHARPGCDGGRRYAGPGHRSGCRITALTTRNLAGPPPNRPAQVRWLELEIRAVRI